MAVIHNTTVTPSKLELLTSWLPSRPWYLGGADRPEPAKAGGFRLDDPAGEVGIEFMVVTDAATAAAAAATYLVPLSYRGAPLEGAEHALVGTMEHGVLGPRWAYDGAHDPVVVAQLLALIEGRAQAQAQSVSNTPDPDVARACVEGADTDFAGAAAIDDQDGTELTSAAGATLRLHRVLRPVPADAPALRPGAAGQVTGVWSLADGTHARGLFAELRNNTGH